mgnify:CR=1 FL=1
MIAYAMVGTNDKPKALAFYDAVLGELGYQRTMDFGRSQAYGSPSNPMGVAFAVGTPFDDMTILSHPRHEDEHQAAGLLNAAQVGHRRLLREAMQVGGFAGIGTEWWHFDCGERDAVRRHWRRIV